MEWPITNASSASWCGSITSSRRDRRSSRNRREALGHVGYFAELIDEWAQESHADERLFRLGASMVDAIADGAPIDQLARYFEYWLLRLQGVYPALGCAVCSTTLSVGAVMPPREHVFVCQRCAPAGAERELSAMAMQFLRPPGRRRRRNWTR